MTHTLQRRLDSFEAPYAQNRKAFVTFAVEYRGTVEEEALAHAFSLVCAQYPVLRGRIRVDGEGWLLYVAPDHHPQLAVADGDETTLRREAETPLDLSKGVTRLTLIRGDEQGYVAWAISHAVTDGHGWWPMWHDLWRLYTDIINGNDISVTCSDSLPYSPSELLKERWGRVHNEPIRPSLVAQPPTPQRDAHDQLMTLDYRLRLTKNDTRALRDAAHTYGTSIHALVCGAIFVALRAQTASTEPKLMICGTAVDLRNRITPSVAATEVTNFIGMHYGNIMVPLHADPIDIGRNLKGQLNTAISNRKLVVAPPNERLSSVKLLDISPPPLAVAQITNPGVLSSLAHPANLEFVDVTSVVPLAELPKPFWWYTCYTYQGRLTIFSCGPSIEHLDEHLSRLRDAIASVLLTT